MTSTSTHPYRDVLPRLECASCRGAKGDLVWTGLGSEWEDCERCSGTGHEPPRTDLLILQVAHLRLAIAKAACDLYVQEGDVARGVIGDLRDALERWGGDL